MEYRLTPICVFALLACAAPLAAVPCGRAGGVAEATAPVMERDARCQQFVATCEVNGHPARLMVDTGATHTVLAAEYVARELPQIEKVKGIRLTGNAHVPPEIARVRLQVGGVEMGKTLVLIMDLSGVNGMMAKPIDGILGMAHLGLLTFTLDVREGGAGYWHDLSAGCALQPLRSRVDAFGRHVISARSGRQAACLLLLDSGSSTTTWPEGQWPAGKEQARRAMRVADINGARESEGNRGKPAPVELEGGVLLPAVSPLLQRREDGHVLGLDALEGYMLIHRPGQGLFLHQTHP